MSRRKWTGLIALLAGSLASLGVLPGNAEVINRGIEAGPYHEARPAPAFLQPDLKIVV